MDVIYRANATDGLFLERWDSEYGIPIGGKFYPLHELNDFELHTLPFVDHVTIGPPADSGYEYLLKQWIQSGDPKARQQCKKKPHFSYLSSTRFSKIKSKIFTDIKSATGIINKLIYQTPERGLLYPVDIRSGTPIHRLQHLSCYLPGVLALGASLLPDSELSPKQKEIHRWAAHGLAYTCYISFADQESGIGPEEMYMSMNGIRWMDVVEDWELGGRRSGEGGVPPGMREQEPERNETRRDYDSVPPNEWLLRPEVFISHFFKLSAILFFC